MNRKTMCFIRRQIAWFVIVTMISSGCAKPPATPVAKNTANSPNATIDATEVDNGTQTGQRSPSTSPAVPTHALVHAYQEVQGYADQTTMRLTYFFDDGRTEVDSTVLKTKFAKPNRLKLEVASEDNRVSIVCDGKQLVTRIYDPVTENFDGQVVKTDAPPTLSVSNLYKATELVDPVTPGEMLSALLGAPTGLDMTPLGILLNEGGLVEILAKAYMKDLGERQLDTNGGPSCRVTQASVPNGDYRLWTDTQTGLLRRIEFPPTRENLPPGLDRIELVAETNHVSTALQDEDFSIEPMLKGTTQEVSHFVLPPLPPPTDLLGETVKRFSFSTANGETLEIANADKDITVLTWFHDHPASRLVVEQLDNVRKRVESVHQEGQASKDQRVKFVSIFVQQSGSKQTVAPSSLQDWAFDAEAVFDPRAVGLNLFNVKQAPTTVVLGPNNSVHYFEVGANPNIGNNIGLVVERLLAGQDVAKETLTVARNVRESYKLQLTQAKAGDGWIEQVEAALPAASLPEKLKLTKAWTNTDVGEPGNMLIVPGKKKQILVTDGWNQLVMLNIDGAIGRRFPLEIPSDAGITMLRAGKNKLDRGLIAAATRGGRRAFVFDFGGKLLMQYPRIPDERSAISDLALGDVDGDKEPELLVSWQGNVGVHGVSLQGKQLWVNRVMAGVVSVGLVKQAKRQSVLVAGEMGALYLVDGDGRTEREVSVRPMAVHQVATWPGSARGFDTLVAPESASLNERQSTYCGLSLSPTGETTAVGLNANWKGLWEYRLPVGVYRHQVELPQSIVLPQVGPTWLIPGPDGSIHFVSADGEFTDSFFFGKHLRGIAGVNLGDEEALLLVATDGAVSAFRVSDDSVPAK